MFQSLSPARSIYRTYWLAGVACSDDAPNYALLCDHLNRVRHALCIYMCSRNVSCVCHLSLTLIAPQLALLVSARHSSSHHLSLRAAGSFTPVLRSHYHRAPSSRQTTVTSMLPTPRPYPCLRIHWMRYKMRNRDSQNLLIAQALSSPCIGKWVRKRTIR